MPGLNAQSRFDRDGRRDRRRWLWSLAGPDSAGLAPAAGLNAALRGYQALRRARATAASVAGGGAAAASPPARVRMLLRDVTAAGSATVDVLGREVVRDVADAAGVSGLALRVAAVRPAEAADLALAGAAGAYSGGGGPALAGARVGWAGEAAVVELELSATARSVWGGGTADIVADLQQQVCTPPLPMRPAAALQLSSLR